MKDDYRIESWDDFTSLNLCDRGLREVEQKYHKNVRLAWRSSDNIEDLAWFVEEVADRCLWVGDSNHYYQLLGTLDDVLDVDEWPDGSAMTPTLRVEHLRASIPEHWLFVPGSFPVRKAKGGKS